MTSKTAPHAWHDLIQTGNAQFAASRLNEALAAYDQALNSVDRLLVDCHVDIALLISKIVTHHNRAATLLRMQRYSEADAAFGQGHAFAQAIVEEDAFPAHLRQAARCHGRLMFSEWQAFRSEHGHHLQECPELLANPNTPCWNRTAAVTLH